MRIEVTQEDIDRATDEIMGWQCPECDKADAS